MKKPLSLLIPLCFIALSLNAGIPSSFTYESYLTPAKDQKFQGPCFAFASIAGIEAMYNLYYGSVKDLSERALFRCSGQPITLEKALYQLSTNGVINDIDYPYPPDISCPPDPGNYSKLYDPTYDCSAGQQVVDRHRVLCSFIGGKTSSHNEEYYKKMILRDGPIIVYLSNKCHCVLIHGWNENGWLVKDSGPCEGVSKSRLYPYSTTTNQITEKYSISEVTEQVYNGSTWTNLNLNKKPFSLTYTEGNEVITIEKPKCFNTGKYILKGLTDIDGAVVESWSANKSGITLTMSADKKSCTISGNASDVTLSVIIKRANGLLEKFNFVIGYVGVPSFTIEKTQGYCAGSNYEITTKLTHSAAPGITYSYSYNIPPLQNNSYVIRNGANAYWVFKAPEYVNFSGTVTYSQPGCTSITSTKTSYLYSLPCGSYYKSTQQEVNESLIENENESFVYPNPASHQVTVKSIGDGVNSVRIIDMTGSIVYQSDFESSIDIDLKGLAKGLYMVDCFEKDSDISYKREKLIVE